MGCFYTYMIIVTFFGPKCLGSQFNAKGGLEILIVAVHDNDIQKPV